MRRGGFSFLLQRSFLFSTTRRASEGERAELFACRDFSRSGEHVSARGEGKEQKAAQDLKEGKREGREGDRLAQLERGGGDREG